MVHLRGEGPEQSPPTRGGGEHTWRDLGGGECPQGKAACASVGGFDLRLGLGEPRREMSVFQKVSFSTRALGSSQAELWASSSRLIGRKAAPTPTRLEANRGLPDKQQ